MDWSRLVTPNIALSAMFYGMDHSEDFVRFAKAHEAWLKEWIAQPNGHFL